jgi:peptidyl-prolyl cis-trans isomerase A (cyclophilin A)
MLKKVVCGLLLALLCAGTAFAAGARNPTAVIDTSLGKITVELYAKEAPLSVANFLDYARSGFYQGTIFHRVIPNFMIQGGGMTQSMTPKPTNAPVKNEAGNGLKNDRGTLAMARTNVVDSGTSQFFINVANNEFLNHRDDTPAGYGYAVFGKVIAGMDVVDAIVNTPTKNMNMVFRDVPVTPVVIKSVTIQK